MDSQQSNLFDTASQPDTGNDAYTFLEFNTQGEDFDYPEFRDPTRSPVSWPTPSGSLAEPSDRGGGGGGAVSDHHSDASPVSTASGSATKGRSGSGGNIQMVDALVPGISGLNFEDTGEDDNFDYGKGDFTEHACKYCGVSNPACVVRCNVPSCRKWFCNSRGNTSGSHIVNHLELCSNEGAEGLSLLQMPNTGVQRGHRGEERRRCTKLYQNSKLIPKRQHSGTHLSTQAAPQ